LCIVESSREKGWYSGGTAAKGFCEKCLCSSLLFFLQRSPGVVLGVKTKRNYEASDSPLQKMKINIREKFTISLNRRKRTNKFTPRL
jgi:hypothetical protein